MNCEYNEIEWHDRIEWPDGMESPAGWSLRCKRTKMSRFCLGTMPEEFSLPIDKNCRYYATRYGASDGDGKMGG